MSRVTLPLALLLGAILAPMPGWAQGRAQSPTEPPLVLKSVAVELPDNDRAFTGAGAEAINNNCLACHSIGMVANQPVMPKAAWQAEVSKMINVYKAPVAATDVAAIVDYLTRTKGPR